MLKLLDKRTESQVIDLAAPEMRHAEEVQVFDTNCIVLTAKLMARFPLPVITAGTDALMAALQVHSPRLAMIGTFLTARQSPGLSAKFIKTELQELRVPDSRSV